MTDTTTPAEATTEKPAETVAPRPGECLLEDRGRTIQTHKPNSKMSYRLNPKVWFSKEALVDMTEIVRQCNKEVGWLGTVRRVSLLEFMVDQIIMFKQGVHAATTEIDEIDLADWSARQLRDNPETGLELINSLRFWGHSHVDMGLTPSSQDEDQTKQFLDNGCEYFIRGICNKEGKMQIDVFIQDYKLEYLDVEWEEWSDPEETTRRKAFWKEEIATKCKLISTGATSASSYNTNHTRRGNQIPFDQTRSHHGNDSENHGSIETDIVKDHAPYKRGAGYLDADLTDEDLVSFDERIQNLSSFGDSPLYEEIANLDDENGVEVVSVSAERSTTETAIDSWTQEGGPIHNDAD